MTSIEFLTGVRDKLSFTCLMLRKAVSLRAQVAVLVTDEAELMRLDEKLWTFSDQDFVPHVRADDPLAASTPVILTANAEAALPHHEVLLNIGQVLPAHFARFERLIEIVSSDADEVAAGRKRYRHYHERGYPMTHKDRSANEQLIP